RDRTWKIRAEMQPGIKLSFPFNLKIITPGNTRKYQDIVIQHIFQAEIKVQAHPDPLSELNLINALK
ncbi:hypothetical protein, partial [Methanosarcina mazei]|uniref:hypothetical protein n=1 Tax=Methanosarcina mazei TaxID=2209 RepID=UPI001F37A8C6